MCLLPPSLPRGLRWRERATPSSSDLLGGWRSVWRICGVCLRDGGFGGGVFDGVIRDDARAPATMASVSESRGRLGELMYGCRRGGTGGRLAEVASVDIARVDGGRLCRGVIGVDGRDLLLSGELGWGVGTDDAETKVSLDEVELRRRSSSRRDGAVVSCEGAGYCSLGPDVWPGRTASCACMSFNRICWEVDRVGRGDRITVSAFPIDFGGVEARGLPLDSRALGCEGV